MKRALVLGGTSFMGRAIVEDLAASGMEVIMVNRGTSYWNGFESSTPQRIKWIKGNRKKSSWAKAITTAGGTYDAVVDMTAFGDKEMEGTLPHLAASASISDSTLYFYISSDSVYEVCDLPSGSDATSEEQAVRPADAKVDRKKRKRDSYGDGTATCALLLLFILGTVMASCAQRNTSLPSPLNSRTSHSSHCGLPT